MSSADKSSYLAQTTSSTTQSVATPTPSVARHVGQPVEPRVAAAAAVVALAAAAAAAAADADTASDVEMMDVDTPRVDSPTGVPYLSDPLLPEGQLLPGSE